jgi:LacI family transcriptional regulator
VSLAGIDDFPWAGTFAPRLTTQKQPIEALAEHAVRILQARMQNDTIAPERIVLASELIVRESCAPPADPTRPSRSQGPRATSRHSGQRLTRA